MYNTATSENNNNNGESKECKTLIVATPFVNGCIAAMPGPYSKGFKVSVCPGLVLVYTRKVSLPILIT